MHRKVRGAFAHVEHHIQLSTTPSGELQECSTTEKPVNIEKLLSLGPWKIAYGTSLVISFLFSAYQIVHIVNRVKVKGYTCSSLASSGPMLCNSRHQKRQFSTQAHSSPSYPNTYDSQFYPHLYCLTLKKQPLTSCACCVVGMGKCLLWKLSLCFYALLGFS